MGKGIPVPHAEFLERLMKRTMFPNKTADQSFLELYGDVSDLDNATLARLQNLEYSVLDVDNVKLYARLARRCMEREQALPLNQTSGRRQDRVIYGQIVNRGKINSFNNYDSHIMKTLMSLMQQSVYSTRLMLQRTNPIRSRYRSDISFNIGQMYGSLMELKTKAARVLNTISHMLDDKEIKLSWYLLLYERTLQITTDCNDLVHRIFELNRGGAKVLLNENPAASAYKDEEEKRGG